ncbi:hypothetical protein JVT61DRAFT_8649 [Boletus reticuloceps]|uniref:Oxidoreductase family protein n=1 Tax=Boletus reticuloceps TaxID=495285 RepID=A0A8I2YWC9_9AGAM|nr:hypothetical protein JVT61DRAFT_8649 [Boletus reticuloceps]
MSRAANTGVAILGSGIFAKEAHLPALKALGSLAPNLKAVYSRSEKSARELADEAVELLHYWPDIYHDGDPAVNLDALLARPDVSIVIVVLPITLQPSIVLKALAAGKHVISEKPVAPDVASGLKLIATYEAGYKPKGLVWRVAENWEVEPGYTTAAQAIRAGRIGKVTLFSLRNVGSIDKESKWYKTPWRTVPDYQGGFLLDGGVHSAAALRVILPSPLAYLSGFASLNVEWLAPHDTLISIIKCADGSHGIFELSFAAPTQSRSSIGDGIVITGTDGYLTVNQTKVKDPVTGDEKSVFRVIIKSIIRNADGKEGPEREEVIDEAVRGVEVELASFFAAVVEGKDDGLGSPRGALRDVAMIEASLNSGGQLIDLEKLVTPA